VSGKVAFAEAVASKVAWGQMRNTRKEQMISAWHL